MDPYEVVATFSPELDYRPVVGMVMAAAEAVEPPLSDARLEDLRVPHGAGPLLPGRDLEQPVEQRGVVGHPGRRDVEPGPLVERVAPQSVEGQPCRAGVVLLVEQRPLPGDLRPFRHGPSVTRPAPRGR